MARNNLIRIFSSISDVYLPKIIEPLIVTNSTIRLFCSTSQQTPPHRDENPNKEAEETEKLNLHTQDQTDQNGEEEDDDDGLDINKETGEIGGPRGPEPTRYGDWEQRGRCSDF